MELLIKKGIEINAKDKNGQTALFLACEKGNRRIVHVLLNGGIDVNARRDPEGGTALDCATIWGRTKVAEILRAAGGKGVRPISRPPAMFS